MEKEILINPQKLFTKSEYHKRFGTNRVKIDQMIKDKELKTITVKGTTLILIK